MEGPPRLRTVPRDRYGEFRLIGQGGMGLVFLALDADLNRRVAFKIARPGSPDGTATPAPATPLLVSPPPPGDAGSAHSFRELKVRMLQEAWVTGALEHPGIVPVYEVGETETGVPYYTMRYIRGERTLAAAIHGAASIDERLALLEPFLKVCDTVRFAHSRGVVHRDLKPDNIALGEYGEVVVLDWGLSKTAAEESPGESVWRARVARVRETEDVHTEGTALGSPGYMSPEAALGKMDEVDARSDVFSLGVILHEILAGRRPHAFRTFLEYVERVLKDPPSAPAGIDPAVPEELSRICVRALAPEKADRLGSVDELASLLRRWQTEGPARRQVEALFLHARGEVATAAELSGAAALRHLDRAVADATRILQLAPGDADAGAMLAKLRGSREAAIRERMRADRVRLARRAGVAALALSVLAFLVVRGSLESRDADAAERARRDRVRIEQESAVAEEAREGERRTRVDVARAAAQLARERREAGAHAAARLYAARAVAAAATPEAWSALAAAEADPAPHLLWQRIVPAKGPVVLCVARTLVAHGGEDGVVRLFDAVTGAPLRDLAAEGAPITALAASRDGSRLYAGDAKGEVRDWELGAAAGESRRLESPPDLRGPSGLMDSVTALAVSADGAAVAAGFASGAIAQWRAATGGFDKAGGGGASISALEYVTDAGTLAAGTGDGQVKWSGGSFADWESAEIGIGPVSAIRCEAEGITAVTEAGRIGFVSFEDLTHVQGIADLPGGPSRAIAWVPGTGMLAVAHPSEGILLWETREKSRRARIAEFPAPASSISLSGDGSLLAAAGGGVLRVWALGSVGPPTARAVSADGRRAFGADAWGRIAGAGIAVDAERPVASLAEGGGLLVAGRFDGAILAFDAGTGEPRGALRGASDPATALSVSPDGARVLAGTLGGALHLWEPRSGRRVSVDAGDGEPVAAVALGVERIHAASIGGRLRVFDARTFRLLEPEPPAPDVPVTALVESNGRLFLARADRRLAVRSGSTLSVEAAPRETIALRLEPDGEGVRWLDGGGANDALPWLLVPPEERIAILGERYGLRLDGFAVTARAPAGPSPATGR